MTAPAQKKTRRGMAGYWQGQGAVEIAIELSRALRWFAIGAAWGALLVAWGAR